METSCGQCGTSLDYFSWDAGLSTCTSCRLKVSKAIATPKTEVIERHEPDTSEDRRMRFERLKRETVEKLQSLGLDVKTIHRNTHFDFVFPATGETIKVFSNWDKSRGDFRRKLRPREIHGKRDFCILGIVSNDVAKETAFAILTAAEFVRLATQYRVGVSFIQKKDIPNESWGNWGIFTERICTPTKKV